MTYKEAKDNLEEYRNNCAGELDEKTLKTIGRAIDALERKNPWAPDVYGDGYADGELVYDMWRCPNCETSFEIECEKHDYCPKCGQAIDWSDYREET